MAPHAAVVTRRLTAHLHYCPPFQPWGLLHGVAVTVSGVLFWVGVWDILDYAVLPRGWPWRLLAVFLGTAGMYVTGTLWTAPRTGPLRGSYSNIHQQQGVGVGRRGGEEEALPRRSSAAGRREKAPGGASSGGRREHSVVEMAALSGGGRSPPHPSTAPTPVVADTSPGDAGPGGDDDVDVLAQHSPGASSSRCVAYAYDRVPFFSRRGGGGGGGAGGAQGDDGPHGESERVRRVGRQLVRGGAAWMPYSHFFARPVFHRPTFFKHLLSHLAAVAAWTGLWDVLDQSLLPWISQSCVLAPGFVAEYPCVLVKIGFVTLGAAGLHWTGTLYYTLEEEGSLPLGQGHREDQYRQRKARQRGPGRQEEDGGEEEEGVWEDESPDGWDKGSSDGLLPNGGAHHGAPGAGRLTRRGSGAVLLAKLRRRRLALGKATGRMTKRGKALVSLALNSAALDGHR